MKRKKSAMMFTVAITLGGCIEPLPEEERDTASLQTSALVDPSGDLSQFPRTIWPYILVDTLFIRMIEKSVPRRESIKQATTLARELVATQNASIPKGLEGRLEFIEHVLRYELLFVRDRIVDDPAKGWTDPSPIELTDVSGELRRGLRELLLAQNETIVNEMQGTYKLDVTQATALRSRLKANLRAFDRLLGDPDPEPDRIERLGQSAVGLGAPLR